MIAIVDYGAGNTRSIINALKRLGLGFELSADPKVIAQADRVIFPGVGASDPAMTSLGSTGLINTLKMLEQPFLGICLGMQMMTRFSEEGEKALLSLIPSETLAFKDLPKIPHMGWNSVSNLKGPLFKGIPEQTDFYFVHSYYVPLNPYTIAEGLYHHPFSAGIAKDNYFGLQFHPEKSGEQGLEILKNFAAL